MRPDRHIYRKAAAAVIAALLTTVTAMAQRSMYYYPEKEHAAVQLRTNSLYWLAVCPNVGMEIQTDLKLSFQADYIGAWWNSPSRNRYFSNYALQAGLRYYFNAEKGKFPYYGHHAGVYGQMLTYDFEFGGTGYQSKNLNSSWGLGISYGYSFPISSRLALDFTLGLGFLNSSYVVYHPSGEVYIPTKEKNLRYIGPTKLEATLVWNINKKHGNKKKNYFAL